MVVQLPARASTGPRRNRGGRAPTAADVPTVQSGRDPGLNVPGLRIPGVQVPGVSVPQGDPVGQSLEFAGAQAIQVGEVLQAAEARIRSREDAVERAREESGVLERSQTELRRLITEGDLSSAAVLEGYGASLRQDIDSVVANHGGSEESRARLSIRLEQTRAAQVDRAAVASFGAQREKVLATMGDRLNIQTARVRQNPSALMAEFDALDDDIDDMAPGLTPGEEDQFKAAGRAELVLTVVDQMLTKGQVDAAESLIRDTPGIARIFSPDVQRQIFSRIAKVRAQTVQDRKLITVPAGFSLFDPVSREKVFTAPPGQRAPITLSPGERLVDPNTGKAIASVPAAPRIHKLSPGQKVVNEKGEILAESEADPITYKLGPGEEIQDKDGKVLASGPPAEDRPPFGKGLEGSALNNIAQMTPGFAENTLGPEKDRVFMLSVREAMAPSLVPNPDTGILEFVPAPPLPADVVQALTARGVEVPTTPTAVGEQPAPAAQPGAPTAQQDGTEAPTGDAVTSVEPNETVFELAGRGLITGPIAAGKEVVGRIPGAGGPFPEVARTKQFVDLLKRDLVRVLQNNPRFAEGERKAIENEIDITGKVFDDPVAFQSRLIGIDDALEIRLNNALKTVTSGKVSRTERQHALNVANAIQQFRVSLIPPKFEDEQEAVEFAESQPPGTRFLFKEKGGNWKVLSVKAR